MIIGISGKIGSGKDTIGKIIQYLTSNYYKSEKSFDYFNEQNKKRNDYPLYLEWQIKKFADKLKEIVSLLTGISVEDLEKQEVKDRVLGEEWWYFKVYTDIKHDKFKIIPYKGNKGFYDREEDYKGHLLRKPTVRQLLQKVGTDAMRDVIHPNIWVSALFADYTNVCKKRCKKQALGNPEQCTCEEDCIGEKSNWIITDLRFPNELQAIKDRGGITIRVNRPLSLVEAYLKFINPKANGAELHKFCSQFQTIAIDNTQKILNEIGYKDGMNFINENKTIQEHPSETALDGATFDYVIDNNEGVTELIEKVKAILVKEQIIC